MAGYWFNALLGAAAARKSKFTLTLNITADNLQFGVTPHWNAGGGCVIEWGDGSTTTPATTGAAANHTYPAAGIYTVAVEGALTRISCGSTNPGAVTFCNGNWAALGDLTNGNAMFYNCANMDITVDHLPAGLTTAQSMFNGCKAAMLPLASLPDSLTQGSNMFQGCRSSIMTIPRLPSGITGAGYMFYQCQKMTADLDAWVTANPSGWAGMTNGNYMMYSAGSGNSPGTVTGSRSAFEALCPNATFTTAFYGTNTTA